MVEDNGIIKPINNVLYMLASLERRCWGRNHQRGASESNQRPLDQINHKPGPRTLNFLPILPAFCFNLRCSAVKVNCLLPEQCSDSPPKAARTPSPNLLICTVPCENTPLAHCQTIHPVFLPTQSQHGGESHTPTSLGNTHRLLFHPVAGKEMGVESQKKKKKAVQT